MMTLLSVMLLYSIFLATEDQIEDENVKKFFNVFWVVAFAALFIVEVISSFWG